MSKKSKQKLKPLRVDVRVDKQSVVTRTDRAQVVGTNGPNSAIWKSSQDIQAAGQKLVTAGTTLAEVEALVQSLQSQLATALNLREIKIVEFDAAHGVYVANVESHATTPQDITALGVAVFSKSSHALAAPTGIDAAFDTAKGRLQIHVNKAPGMQACVVEVSSDPTGSAPWHRLPGIGAVHKLSGYAPGTYWVRAASARANEISEFTGPVPVVVK
jgi:hypothetical protein